jgi:hypothetical protein
MFYRIERDLVPVEVNIITEKTYWENDNTDEVITINPDEVKRYLVALERFQKAVERFESKTIRVDIRMIDFTPPPDNKPCGYCSSTLGYEENDDGWIACLNCGGV